MKSGFSIPENCPGTTVGFPQYGQDVAAVVASQISSAPHDGQEYAFMPFASAPQSSLRPEVSQSEPSPASAAAFFSASAASFAAACFSSAFFAASAAFASFSA